MQALRTQTSARSRLDAASQQRQALDEETARVTTELTELKRRVMAAKARIESLQDSHKQALYVLSVSYHGVSIMLLFQVRSQLEYFKLCIPAHPGVSSFCSGYQTDCRLT